ncbi:Coenzyme F420 hydrogenase/dehydrogenase, beta subunit C-terminal domain [Rhodococcus sp. P1Y]|uniref:Coenzyme F420 hydrogenase/dehydrogenase, beta subunit C-terminal domain n=1 Tax=Rhodococcus sp. P1Y TaxID=1302308 RepID=UPI000EB4081D|nr:Coenzyme F420 hydrogenase/dehydrogenase, beta subunit C-terminal domain [Rhodococcus sp. P1Y]AYJ48096.1 hypothetical protein D8W71_06845 [Rhodococcus sp. P1Y]
MSITNRFGVYRNNPSRAYSTNSDKLKEKVNPQTGAGRENLPRQNMSTIRLVLENDACVGCGACAVALPDVISMVDTGNGFQTAKISDTSTRSLEVASRICPFADESPSEDEHAQNEFPELETVDSVLGRYESVHYGRVANDLDVSKSSSGGLTTYVTNWLLENGDIDAVIHVGASTDGQLFDYKLSTSGESEKTRKSNYYSCSMDRAIERVRETPGTYAFIGVPCYVTAVRNLMRADPILRERVKYCFALVCGHMKSSLFAESLAWQLGIIPPDLAGVDFRVKSGSGTASGYGFSAWTATGRTEIADRSSDLFGANWGYGSFQLNACNYCDDIFGETADATFGDAWLPEFEQNWRGTNIVVTRDPKIARIIDEGVRNHELDGGRMDTESARATQLGNIRHRREGLAVRLRDDAASGRWAPKKRVSTADADQPSEKRRRIARQRRRLSQYSFKAFAQAKASGRLTDYTVLIAPSLLKYEMAYAFELDWRPRIRKIASAAIRMAGVIRRAAVVDLQQASHRRMVRHVRADEEGK